jgi:hypothetical protein
VKCAVLNMGELFKLTFEGCELKPCCDSHVSDACFNFKVSCTDYCQPVLLAEHMGG